jgi:polyhydroxyalkanoate synthesis regulator phasin
VADLDAAEALGRVELALDGRVHREAVVLRRDLDAAGQLVEHRLVDAAVAEGQLVRAEAERAAQELVAEADAEERQVGAQRRAQQVDVAVGGLRVARPVREEQG